MVNFAWVALGAIGLTVSFGETIGIAASICVPALILRCQSRKTAFIGAALYYGTASWAVIPSAARFLQGSGLLEPTALWITAVWLLSLPWLIFWSACTKQLWWRSILALAAGIVPPLGLIGWASPITAAGLLFPGTGWFGLLAAVLSAAALTLKPASALFAVCVGAVLANAVYPGQPSPPPGWQGINTNFGIIAANDILAEYNRARAVQDIIAKSDATVIVFPESIIGDGPSDTDLLWAETLNLLRDHERTVLLGAVSRESATDFNFAAELTALAVPHTGTLLGIPAAQQFPVPNRNVVAILGHLSGVFKQRVPVPVGMWQPFSSTGVALRMSSPATTRVAGRRVAILICYEQLLPWPVLTSALERPNLLVAVSNLAWVVDTPLPRCQAEVVKAWSRLFSLPLISAVNS